MHCTYPGNDPEYEYKDSVDYWVDLICEYYEVGPDPETESQFVYACYVLSLGNITRDWFDGDYDPYLTPKERMQKTLLDLECLWDHSGWLACKEGHTYTPHQFYWNAYMFAPPMIVAYAAHRDLSDAINA